MLGGPFRGAESRGRHRDDLKPWQRQKRRHVRLQSPAAAQAGAHYPAGVYTIAMATPSILMIRGASNSGLAMVKAVEDNGQRAKRGVAVFHRYGNRYFINEISVTGESRHLHLQPSKAEKQMEIAASKPAPENLEVALIETAH